jgi:hypothetical protein
VVRVQRLDVFRHAHQLLEVEDFASAHVLLKLLWRVKQFEELLVEDLEEATSKGSELLLAELLEQVLHVEGYELISILFGYKFVFTALHQLDGLLLSENLVVDSESPGKNILQWRLVLVAHDILEALGDLRLPELKVSDAWMLTKEKLVAHWMDWDGQDDLVPWGQRQQGSDQLEVNVGLIGLIVEPVKSGVWVVHEHAVVSIEQLFEDQLEVLLLHSSLVDGWLVLELDLQRLLELLLGDSSGNQGVQGVCQDLVSPDLQDEVRRLDDGVYTAKVGQVLQQGLTDVVISLLLGLDTEQLCLPVGVESPWEAVQGEEGETVKLLA